MTDQFGHGRADAEPREWPYWECWVDGWLVIDGALHFEEEDITPLLPPYLVTNADWPWVVTFPLENGWEAIVWQEWGPAINPAHVAGVNRRALGDDRKIIGQGKATVDWEDPGTTFGGERDFPIDGTSSLPYLDDPDQLVAVIRRIAALPSNPDERRNP